MHDTIILDRTVKANVTPVQLFPRMLHGTVGMVSARQAYGDRRNARLNRVLGKSRWTHSERSYLRRVLVAMYFGSLFTREYRSGKFVTARKSGTMAQYKYDPRAVLESAFVALDRFGRAVYGANLAESGKKCGMEPRNAGYNTLWFILCTEKSKYVQKARIAAGFRKPVPEVHHA